MCAQTPWGGSRPRHPGRYDELARHDPVGHDAARVVDVVDEEVQRTRALGEPLLDRRPLGRGDDPRYEVEREDLLGPRVVAVDAERDAHVQHRALGGSLAACDLGRGEAGESAREQAAAGAWAALDVEHLVEKLARVVAREVHELLVSRAIMYDVSPGFLNSSRGRPHFSVRDS
jgi:hypothetical protein